MRIRKLVTGLTMFFLSFVVSGCNANNESYKQLYCIHNFKEVNIAATCTEDGVKMDKCTKCGLEKNIEVINALGHSFLEETHNSTCTEHGHIHKVCEVCGAEETEELPLIDHNYTVKEIRSPTCTEDGYTLKECTMCGATIKTDIKTAPGHTLKTITVEPTCTEQGYTYEKCDVCGLETEHHDFVSALGHDYGEVHIHPLTCTEDEYSYRICNRCHQESEHFDIVHATGHDLHTVVVDPTCYEDGYSYDYCSKCDYVSEHYAIEKTPGHVFRILEKEPTCTEKGYLVKECVNCDEVEYTEYPALQHNFIEKTVAPTCTEEGYTHHICTICGAEDETTGRYNIKAALGHLPKTIEAKEPTCTEEGYTSHTVCTLCGIDLEPVTIIPKTEHNYQEIENVESTCFLEGYTLLECLDCHHVEKVDKGLANNHHDENSDKICDGCGAHLIYTEADFWNIENDMSGNYVLMDNITLTRATPLGIKEGHEAELDISVDHAIPFTGSLTSNIDNKTISYSIKETTYGSSITAPIYINQGLIKGVNCNIQDVEIQYADSYINSATINEYAKQIAGLTLINQGTIQECGCVDSFNIDYDFELDAAFCFDKIRQDVLNYKLGGLTYLNDTNGVIGQCFNTATVNLNETILMFHNGYTESSVKFDATKAIALITTFNIGSIAFTNDGAISDSSGSLKMNTSINGNFTVVPEKYNILTTKITEGFGNTWFISNINVQQIAKTNNGTINDCLGEVINTTPWSISAVYYGRGNRFPERVRFVVTTNPEWFKNYGDEETPIINTIDMDDEVPDEEVDDNE